MISIAFDKYTLPNGLQVILHEDHSLPMAAVNIWYHVGSKDEDQGRTGFAHLFEHVMFEGSKNHNELFFNPLMKVGGSVNGSTSSDKTNYWENVPSDYLELALWLESDRMGFLLEALDQERLDLQRDVVKNERRQSYENRPYGMAYLLLQPALFPAPHPYSWPTIGSQEDLDAASLDDVKSFFRRFYSPSNASISIAGDIDPDGTRDLVERYFGEIPPTPAVNRIGRMASTLSSETRLDFHDKVQLPRLYLVWPSTPAFDEDEAALDVLGTVLADGRSSRLYRTLVYEKQIARSVSVYNHAMEVAGEFNVQVTASPGHGLDEIQDVVEEELDRIRSEPLSEQRDREGQEPGREPARPPAGADGRFRRTGGPAELLQHLRRRPRHDQHRSGAVHRRTGRGRAARGGPVARRSQGEDDGAAGGGQERDCAVRRQVGHARQR